MIEIEDKKFGKYLDIPKLNEVDMKKDNIRRGVITALFCGFILFLRFGYK